MANSIDSIIRLVENNYQEWVVAKKMLDKAKQETERAAEKASNAKKAQAIFQSVAKNVQQNAHDQIAGIVSTCLSSVFDEPYEFRIEFEQKRGKTEARLSFIRDGMAVDPLTGSGGGVVDVAAFALRLAALMLSRPAQRRLLVLDEPFRFVSANHQESLQSLVLSLSEKLDIQFLIVTHIDAMQIGKIVEL